MSGQWSQSRTKHSAFCIQIDTSIELNFNDPRRFGTIKFTKGLSALQKKLSELGPDVLEVEELDSEIFVKNILKNPSKIISEVLMDQRCVAGIGNYLRAEILFDCGINPWKSLSELEANQYLDLCKSITKVSKLSYCSKGASIKTYRNVDGAVGGSQFAFKVYSREKCPSGHKVTQKRDSNGRMVHWCDTCQP